MFFNKLIGKIFKSDKDNSLEAGTSDTKMLDPAIEALKENNFQNAVNFAFPFINSPYSIIRVDALRICALGESGLCHWREAFDYFMALSRLELSVHNILQMSTTALMSGFINEAHHWFDRAVELNIKAEEMPQASMHSAFLAAVSQSGRLKEGLAHVEWLKRAYQTISIVDDHLLHMYGLPFFSVFLEKSFPILQASRPQEEIHQWYKSMHEHLSEDGQNILSSRLEVVL